MVTGGTTTTTTANTAMATTTSVHVAPVQTTMSVNAVTPVKRESPARLKDTDSQQQESPDVSISNSDSTPSSLVAFVPEACLFCPQISSSLDTSLAHMQKGHGLFIPTSIDDNSQHLAVDMETLVEYMHLVIFGYQECLYCGTQRASGWAVRQHMMGRGHCRIDLAGLESEWRDFYESDGIMGSEDEDENEDIVEDEANPNIAKVDGQTPRVRDGDILRLSSGKIVSHRAASVPKPHRHKPLAGDESRHSWRGISHLVLEDLIPTPEQSEQSRTTSLEANAADVSSTMDPTSRSSSSIPPSQEQALSRADRRRLLGTNKSAITSAVATMSKHDRAALAHLSPAERRAMVVGQFKHQERVNVAKRKYWSKFERRQDQPAEGGKVYIGGG